MPLVALDDPLCSTCGTQYDASDYQLTSCHICDDPRQYVPPAGQSFTTLRKFMAQDPRPRNVFEVEPSDPRVMSITTDPPAFIGQRAYLIKTAAGNILWDCIALLDEETEKKINELGGISAMVISHPHFYTTHLGWAETFSCPVYLASQDAQWLSRKDDKSRRKFVTTPTLEILPGVTAIVAGGHFPGSMCLHWESKLFTADTIGTARSGLFPGERPPGTVTYAFLWSFPNMIPLSPRAIHGIWDAVKPFSFTHTHGGFPMQDVRGDAKRKLLRSMKTVVRAMGYDESSKDASILTEADL